MKIKIFTDILREYQELKYIFEYGFTWTDQLTELLFDKTSQASRRIWNILEMKMGQQDAVEWKEVQSEQKGSKCKRVVMLKNHYHLKKNVWFQSIYGCFGANDEENAEKNKKARKVCREKGEADCSKCARKTLCEIESFERSILEAVQEKKCLEDWTEKNDIKIRYADIFDGDKIRENMWTSKQLAKNLKEGEYESFLKMVSFFAEAAPLSALGYHFLRRLGAETIHPYIFVRNLYPDYIFEQESIFRCLYAIWNDCCIIKDDKAYKPIQLFYRDADFQNEPIHLYLKAEEKDTGIITQINLSGGSYFCAGDTIPFGKLKKEKKKQPLNDSEKEEHKILFRVVYFYNMQKERGETTEYIFERRKMFQERETKTIERGIQKNFASPYYPQNVQWEAEEVWYEIPKRDIEGFLDFVQSFGDFAYMKDLPYWKNKREAVRREKEYHAISSGKRKAAIKEEQSLCSNYSAESLIAKTEKGTLPPRIYEIIWLGFILEAYPNICRIFIDETLIKNLKEKIRQECEKYGEKRISGDIWSWEKKVSDIRPAKIEKYRRIFQAVEKKDILYGAWKDEKKAIYPYAIEYRGYSAKNDRKRETPFEVMGYNLNEKRTVLITYKNIRSKETKKKSEYDFSMLDKLYHCLAAAVRCAVSSDESAAVEPDESIMNILKVLWQEDKRGNHNYQRILCKKYVNKVWDYEYAEEYKKLYSMAGEKEKDFIAEVFQYWKENFQKDPQRDLEQCYQTVLLKCFSDGCQLLWKNGTDKEKARKKKLMDQLNTITKEQVWDLIGGNCENGMNEIAFYNERLKNEKVSFRLKNAGKDNIDKIYRVFSDFLCTGNLDSNGMDILFTVTYEKFYYRKIHMCFMMILDEIDDIMPKNVAALISQRRRNQKLTEQWYRFSED